MKKMIRAMLVCIGCTLSGDALAAEPKEPALNEQLTGLVYFFAEDDRQHRIRADKLDQLLVGSGLALHFVKIDQLQVWSGPLKLADLAPTAAGDLLVLVDGDRQLTRSVAYNQVPALLGLERISTDIDESTWGKVKELFR